MKQIITLCLRGVDIRYKDPYRKGTARSLAIH